MASPLTAEQFELITSDPRAEKVFSVMDEWRKFRELSKQEGGLITAGAAGKFLGVPTGQVNSWMSRGRLSVFELQDVKFLSGREVMALYKEREVEGPRTGGRGKKAPSLAEVVRAAAEDMSE